MTKDSEVYHDNLESLNKMYPDIEMLNKKQVAKYLGMDYRTVSKLFKFKKNFISKRKLASELSQ